MVILDDATSEIYYAQLVEEESTVTVMAGLREVIERKGVFCALYSDRGSHFWLTPKAGGKVDPHRLTQVGRAMHELGVQMIPAYSPQARGRSERSFGTWQGRLPQELRLRGIRTLEAANRFCASITSPSSIAASRSPPRSRALRLCPAGGKDLERIFSLQFERTVNRDNTVSFQNLSLQIEPVRWRGTLAGCTVDRAPTPGRNLEPDATGRTVSVATRRRARSWRRRKWRPTGRGKDARWKSPKPTFPPRLEIPQTARDSHFPTAPTAAG